MLIVKNKHEARLRLRRLGATSAICVLLGTPPALADTPACAPQSMLFSYVLTGGVGLAIIVALLIVKVSLDHTTWSLADALSEEADVSPKGADGKPIPGQVVSEMRGSVSRLIALLGLISLLMIYIGLGLTAIQQIAAGGPVPDLSKMNAFLLAGMTMFAPYIANKFSSVFDWLKPTRP